MSAIGALTAIPAGVDGSITAQPVLLEQIKGAEDGLNHSMGKAEPVEVAGSLPSDLSALEWAEHLGLAGSVYQNAGGETLQRTVKTREWEIMTSVRESGTDKSEGAGIGLMPISTDLPELQEQASLDLATVTYIGILLALSVLRVLVWRRFEWQPSPPRINRSIEE